MELAADSISVKVSEAIMHMQENSVTISTKVRTWAQVDDGDIKVKNKMDIDAFFFHSPRIWQFGYSSTEIVHLLIFTESL